MSSPDIISSTANPLVKKIRSLAMKKHRDEEGLFIVEGARHVGEALAAGWQAEMLVHADALPRDFAASTARHVRVTPDILSKITNRDNAQSVIGVFRQKTCALADIADGLWVALEGVRDPGNLGTIIRTAHAVGAQGVLLVGQTCDPFSPECIRASMGSFAAVKIAQADVASVTAWKKTWRGRMVGTHLDAKTDYRQQDYSLPLMLVMGGESHGLSPDMTAACDALVRIPMAGQTESLNLAVSTGVMLYEACRARV